MNCLHVSHITKQYASGVGVEDLSLSVASGELVTLIGPSGCGKSTLLRTIAGLTQPDQGQVLLAGRDLTQAPPERREIVMLFQQPLLFPHLTVEGNVGFSLRLRRAGKDLIRQRVADALRMVQLEGLEGRYPDQLSGGQQQRVALARALVARPKVLLLDEPFSALDAPLRAEMRELLRRLQRELGLTMLFVTHDQEEAALLGDRIAVMAGGRLHQTGTAADLYYRPQSPVVAGFFGASTLVRGEVHDGAFHSVLGIVPSRGVDYGPAVAVIHPEQVILEPPRDGQPHGEVVESRFAAGFLLVRLQRAGVLLQSRLPGLPPFAVEPGRAVAVQLREPVWCMPETPEEENRCPSPLTLSAG